MAQPLAQKNKCLVHNLLKRSLGLPYKFSWSEDEFTRAPKVKLRRPFIQDFDVLAPRYGVPCMWDIDLTWHNGSEPKQERQKTALRIDSRQTGAVGDTKECGLKGLKTHELTAGISSQHFNCKSTKPVMSVYRPCFPKMMKNQVLKPKALHCPFIMDKVFCCEWITDEEVVFGTKCHKLLHYNTTLDCFTKIMETDFYYGTPNSTGIRCMKCNPSSTLLATVDSSGFKVALYLLPCMTPFICIAETLDNNRIFDLCWLSNSKLAAAGREGIVTIWDFRPLFVHESGRSSPISVGVNGAIQALTHSFESSSLEQKEHSLDGREFDEAPEDYREVSLNVNDRIRALAFNGNQTLFVLSSSGCVFSFNTVTYKSIWSMEIPGGLDNTCLAYSESLKLLAIGSSVCVLFIEDCGGIPHLSQVELPTANSLYVRSLAFQGQTLSIGTGAGQLFFVDLSLFWKGKLSYYRTMYLFPLSERGNEHKLDSFLDPKRDFFFHSHSLHLVDTKLESYSRSLYSRVETFDKPLSKTFYEVVKSFRESGDSQNINRKIEKYYADLENLCEEDSDSKYYAEEYSRRKLSNFEAEILRCAQKDREALLSEDGSAVYAQSYNPNTGQLFVAGGPLSVLSEGAFCSLLR